MEKEYKYTCSCQECRRKEAKCNKCNSMMEFVTQSDNDNGIFWCKNCGTLLIMDMEDEEKWEYVDKNKRGHNDIYK